MAEADPRVAGAAPFIETEALLSGPRNQPAMLRGVEPALEAQVSVLSQKMKRGTAESLTDGAYNILLGQELAIRLGVDVGDVVMVMISNPDPGRQAFSPRHARFSVTGVFEVGHSDIDRGIAVVHMADLQRLLQRDGASGVRLRLHDVGQAHQVASDLSRNLPDLHRISDWTRNNAALRRALGLQKAALGILLSLIILMGAFTLVNSQVMLVTDKQADIAILRTLGLTPGGIMQVFMVQGTLIGIIGTVLGFVGGVTLTWNLERILDGIEALFNVSLMPEGVYYVTGLPTDMQTGDMVLTVVVALLMSFLATLYPAWRAARTPPADALRFD